MATVSRPPKLSAGQRILNFEITPKKVKPVHLMNFCRYLSVFLTAGIPILEALEIIRFDTPDKKLRSAISEISLSLRAGDNLSTAVSVHSRAFPSFFVSMLSSAETTGQVAPVLAQLAKYIERDIEASRKFKSALTYPAIVIVLALVSVTILVAFVLPQFVKFFASFRVELPLPTRILISISKFVVHSGLTVLVILVLTAIAIGGGTMIGQGRLLRDRLFLRLPLVGKILRFAAVERFCRILSSMVSAGVPLPVGLELAASGASNRAFGQSLTIARREMLEGAGLSGPLAGTGLFPPAAVQMLRVGEETGTLETRLEEISEFYGKELEYRLKRLTDMLEPISVIFVGIVVGFVAVAIISAIYGVFNGTKIK